MVTVGVMALLQSFVESRVERCQKETSVLITMEIVQKLMKKTSKYLFYSPLTEKVLTECPCI